MECYVPVRGESTLGSLLGMNGGAGSDHPHDPRSRIKIEIIRTVQPAILK